MTGTTAHSPRGVTSTPFTVNFNWPVTGTITDVFTTPYNRRKTRNQSSNGLHNEQIFFDWLQYAADNNLTNLFPEIPLLEPF